MVTTIHASQRSRKSMTPPTFSGSIRTDILTLGHLPVHRPRIMSALLQLNHRYGLAPCGIRDIAQHCMLLLIHPNVEGDNFPGHIRSVSASVSRPDSYLLAPPRHLGVVPTSVTSVRSAWTDLSGGLRAPGLSSEPVPCPGRSASQAYSGFWHSSVRPEDNPPVGPTADGTGRATCHMPCGDSA